jgi:mRNA-degrading endonuclease RelE of RelBE toxin-antitoxin system
VSQWLARISIWRFPMKRSNSFARCRRNFGIDERLAALESNFQGDIKKLIGAKDKYRLRLGNHRVLFRLAGKQIQVYAVKDRKEAYE